MVTGAGVRLLLGTEDGEKGVGEELSRSSWKPACVWATLSVVV